VRSLDDTIAQKGKKGTDLFIERRQAVFLVDEGTKAKR
jgi:hypothetical protein